MAAIELTAPRTEPMVSRRWLPVVILAVALTACGLRPMGPRVITGTSVTFTPTSPDPSSITPDAAVRAIRAVSAHGVPAQFDAEHGIATCEEEQQDIDCDQLSPGGNAVWLIEWDDDQFGRLWVMVDAATRVVLVGGAY